jgi:hypothetical protein
MGNQRVPHLCDGKIVLLSLPCECCDQLRVAMAPSNTLLFSIVCADLPFTFFFFWWYWDLNSELCYHLSHTPSPPSYLLR